ncbi:MAG: IS1634 family transposase [Erysipelotrichaceae bacterium]|nr:IS1634 family transposase [Erysipelotrichaceae bacterium]
MASLQKRHNKGHDYWYIVESKRVNGKPRPIVIQYLGTIENILKHFRNGADDSKSTYKSYAHGAAAALIKIAQKTDLLRIMAEFLPSQTRDGLKREETLLLAAIHRVIQPGSKKSFAEWAGTTTLPTLIKFNPDEITSQHFWDQMDGITTQQLQDCEDAITRHIFELYSFQTEKLILDYTNYYSYIATANEKNTLAKRGHNKQKRYDLRQYSLAVVTTKDVLFPMCSYIYEGNVNDQGMFPLYLDQIKVRVPGFDVDRTTLVYDGGSNNKANLAKLEGLKLHYICALSLSVCKELFDIAREAYEPVRINDQDVLCYRLRREIWGQERECFLLCSPALCEGQVRDLEKNLAKNMEELADLLETIRSDKSRIKKDPASIRERIKNTITGAHQHELIKVEIEGDPVVTGLSWSINEDVRQDIIHRLFGKKLLISDHQDWSTQEILSTYNNQYLIEKVFKDTKNPHHFAIRPQYHWTDMKTRVHIFCCLLGLVLTSLLRKELADHGIFMENTALIDELSKIREVWVFKKSKKNKSGLKIEKELEMMNDKQTHVWTAISSL